MSLRAPYELVNINMSEGSRATEIDISGWTSESHIQPQLSWIWFNNRLLRNSTQLPTNYFPSPCRVLYCTCVAPSASNMIVLVYSLRGGSERVQERALIVAELFPPITVMNWKCFFFLQICFSKSRLKKHWSIYTLTMFSGVCGFLLWL